MAPGPMAALHQRVPVQRAQPREGRHQHDAGFHSSPMAQASFTCSKIGGGPSIIVIFSSIMLPVLMLLQAKIIP